jgi:hypothetical protein
MTQRNALDDILTAVAPRVSAQSPELTEAISAMASETRLEVRPRRRLSRPLATGLAAMLVVGGGATAAAAATWQWHPWAQDPDASFMVTMPSGAICEYRVGGVSGAPADIVSAFVASHDIVALADVEGAIAQARADGQTMYDENGDLQPAGPGTAMYNADFEYQSALNLAVSELVKSHLEETGDLAPYQLNMQADCDDQ